MLPHIFSRKFSPKLHQTNLPLPIRKLCVNVYVKKNDTTNLSPKLHVAYPHWTQQVQSAHSSFVIRFIQMTNNTFTDAQLLIFGHVYIYSREKRVITKPFSDIAAGPEASPLPVSALLLPSSPLKVL